MLAKVLFINPELGPTPRKRDDQKLIIAADDEALVELARAATKAIEGDTTAASVVLEELESHSPVTYKFVSLNRISDEEGGG
jgi:hypothetical protein